MHPSPEHHSQADLGAVIRQKPAVVKHPMTSQLGGERGCNCGKTVLVKQDEEREKREGEAGSEVHSLANHQH